MPTDSLPTDPTSNADPGSWAATLAKAMRTALDERTLEPLSDGSAFSAMTVSEQP
jgi:hypothetical protein